MDKRTDVIVRIKHESTEVEFEGDRNEVWEAVNKYFSQTLGPLELVSRLTGEVDVTYVTKKLADKVVIRKDDIHVLQRGDTKKRIVLCLLAAYVGKRLGLFEEDTLTPKKVAAYLHIDERVARARLSELWKEGIVDRDENGRYLIKPYIALKFIE